MNEAEDGSCDDGLGLVWHCYWIFMSFICLIQKKNICFGFLKGRGCLESKNKTSAKRKSTISSLDPSIIQVASFKCRADVPLQSVLCPVNHKEIEQKFTFHKGSHLQGPKVKSTPQYIRAPECSACFLPFGIPQGKVPLLTRLLCRVKFGKLNI